MNATLSILPQTHTTHSALSSADAGILQGVDVNATFAAIVTGDDSKESVFHREGIYATEPGGDGVEEPGTESDTNPEVEDLVATRDETGDEDRVWFGETGIFGRNDAGTLDGTREQIRTVELLVAA